MDRFPIVMKTWAGSEAHDFEYIARSIPSLLASELPAGAEILIFDDCSADPKLLEFLRKIAEQDRRVRIIRFTDNKGPNLGQEEAYRIVEAEYPDAPFFINVDDDVVYHPQWFSRLLDAYHELNTFGLEGILTALNMPWRTSFAQLSTASHRYILKWKQPALNWFIPRVIYDQIGPFVDEGIAYDTAYSHWLRLLGYPIICLKPSYVQNIGTFGAYSRDTRTTADDFLGEPRITAWCRALPRRISQRLTHIYSRITDGTPTPVAPIRWGTDWVYEAIDQHTANQVALFLVDHAVQMGWTPQHVQTRAQAILQHQIASPVAVQRIISHVRQHPLAVQCLWPVWPTLRERRKYARRYSEIDIKQLLTDVLQALIPLHQAGIVHNKIRQDNVFFNPVRNTYHLAWYGTEPVHGRRIVLERQDVIRLFAQAVDKRAREAIRERFATWYLEAIAPEVLAGEIPTPRSDIYAVGAVVLLALLPKDLRTLEEIQAIRDQWAIGHLSLPADQAHRALRAILAQCVSPNPMHRFADARELHHAVLHA
ncbi:MAG: glycosyltransferase [Nitrospirae bacterium]|nr:MAG: glycosyltransferase [Nitrospirota bacterium]